jgi:hypothetical protein
MPLLAVRAIYDGEHIHLLEAAPVSGSYRVLVTFVAPADAEERETDLDPSSSLWDTFGAWQDERPAEEVISEIRAARSSKAAPPALV